MTKVLYVSADWGWDEQGTPVPGGSCFYRVVQPATALGAHGFETMAVRHFCYDDQTGEILGRAGADSEPVSGFDVVVFQRWMHQSAPSITRRAQAYGQIVVQDVDDWYWGLTTSNNAFDAAHPKLNPTTNRNHYWKALAQADLITVSTPYLAERLARLGVPTVVVPNAIDLTLFEAQRVSSTTEPTVGWVGAVPWRSGDLEILRGVIGPWMKRHGLRFIHGGHVEGATPAAELLGLDPVTPTVERPLVPVWEYPRLFEGIEIFVAPLSDVPFNQAKSNVKLLEASAAGIPWVASAIGPYENAEGGRLARRPKDWLRHLEALLDPGSRAEQQAAQRAWVEQYSMARSWESWVRAYGTVARVDRNAPPAESPV